VQVFIRPHPIAGSASAASVVIRLILPVGGGNASNPDVIVVSNVPHSVVVGTTPGTVTQKKPTVIRVGTQRNVVTVGPGPKKVTVLK
jgi:hypothetical protein